MLGSRRGRPSLIGRAATTAARTAVISGTATAVSGRVAGRDRTAAPAAAPAPADAPAPAPAPSGGITDEALGKLRQLAELRTLGVLTDAEFEEQKARLLA